VEQVIHLLQILHKVALEVMEMQLQHKDLVEVEVVQPLLERMEQPQNQQVVQVVQEHPIQF
tara:strand:- start:224 stop:406 length:183 start_codon:yes stop_codon:yes gene_type:complete